jgi:hypothetical protein
VTEVALGERVAMPWLAYACGTCLFITSANVSSGVTGHLEPAHYDLHGIQEDFGDCDGVVFIGHRNEAPVRASYTGYLPMSTSILAFHKLTSDDDGRPALILERQGRSTPTTSGKSSRGTASTSYSGRALASDCRCGTTQPSPSSRTGG